MSPRIFHTDNMELSIAALEKAHAHVIAYLSLKAIRPIRPRWDLVKTKRFIEHCYAWKPTAGPVLERWQQEGGVMIYRPEPNTRLIKLPPCDALLLVECPVQIDVFESLIANVRQEVVVYRPPTWNLHVETVEHRYPQAGTYIAMESMFKGFVGRELTDEEDVILQHTGFNRASTAVFTADDVKMITGWTEKYLRMALNYRYKYCSARYDVYTMRIRPDHNEVLTYAWQIMEKQLRTAPGEYAMRRSEPAGPYIKGFKAALRQLMLKHYVSRDESVYVIDLSGKPIEADRLDAVNNMYRGRWYKMRNLIDQSPEFKYD
jgi:hypothetical protein